VNQLRADRASSGRGAGRFCSLYGVRDPAGSMREWSAGDHLDGRRTVRPVRGGAWTSSARLCRMANRYGYTRSACTHHLGFRVVRSVEADPG